MNAISIPAPPPRVGFVIPACNEESTVGSIVQRCAGAIPEDLEVRICVVDNDSTDATAAVAAQAGAEVVHARPRGYGLACQKGIEHLADWAGILLFSDADGSSRPEESERLLRPLLLGRADLVIGVRPSDAPMTLPQRWGTRLAARLIQLRWGQKISDIGPFRAISTSSLRRLGMRDRTWGWTVEMQILALLAGLRIEEVPVSWEARIAGQSKISGTISGVLRAGARILWTLAKYGLKARP